MINRKWLFCVGLCVALLSTSCSITTQKLTLVFTTDVHGKLDTSMARLASYVQQVRFQNGQENVLLFDGGDLLQGTPYAYYANHVRSKESTHVCAEIINDLQYTALAVGNHDIESGKDVFTRVYQNAASTTLCANAVYVSTREPFFVPYIIIKKGSFRIAVLGLTTPYVSTWVAEHLRPGIDFLSLEDEAERWINYINQNEKPDFVIGLFHSGFSGGQLGDWGMENASLWVATHIPGFDVILFGHDHLPLIQKVKNVVGKEVLLVNPGGNLENWAQVDVELTGFHNRSQSVSEARLIVSDSIQASQDYLERFATFFHEVHSYQNTPIAQLSNNMSSEGWQVGSCNWVDEVHVGQLYLAGLGSDILADISFASPLKPGALKSGMLFMKDFFTWFPYENSLCVVKMTGEEVVKYLEYSYLQLGASINFDSAAGILYNYHINRPVGQRVEVLSMANGARFSKKATYNVAINSYRVMGGGGHLKQALGWNYATTRDRVIWESPSDMRRMFMEWEKSRSPFTASVLNNWTIVND